MTNINQLIKELKEYQELEKSIKAEMEALKQEAIEYMESIDVDEILTPEGKITYREVISNRFDSTGFKKEYLELYKQFAKKTSNMRFTLN